MDHDRPVGRLSLRLSRIGLLGLLAAAILLGACGGSESVLTTLDAPTTTTSTTAAATTSTTSTSTTTSTSSTTTTTTTIVVEAWHVPGQAYYFPVQPPEAAAYSDAHHHYPATDIFAPVGTVFVAVTDGVIDELSREDRYDPAVDDGATRGGRFVSLIGDDGVRYYCSHLETVEVGLEAGDRVIAGQRLGTVGRSGNAAGTSPHCHFGISRPTFPGDWEVRRGEVWPYQYLQAWTRGEDVKPVLPGE